MAILRFCVRATDKIVNIVIVLCLAVAMLYGGYALWDTWKVYQGATLDVNLINYRPTDPDDSTSFADLQRINPDICAWLAVDATRINAPVVRGQDNEKYVDTDIYGDYSLSGSLFLDYRNRTDFTDLYSIIYGHHMDGGRMFGDLDLFTEKEFFDEHDTGWLYLDGITYKITFFAFTEVSAFDTTLFSLAANEAQQAQLLDYVAQWAMYYRQPEAGKPVLALSTCTTAQTNGRALLLGTLEPHVPQETQDVQ